MKGSRFNTTIYGKLSRKKTFAADSEPGKEKLSRVLNVFDLTALGIGCTLGSGIYVLVGTVAKSVAGPAVVLSFIVAAVVSSFSGVCYSEFAGRVPNAGSAYIYSYVAVGELIAFMIGWTLYIEHTISTASVAKAMTNYFDSLLGNPQKRYMKKHFPFHMEFLGEYPDVASFLFVMLIALVVAWGVRKSSNLNKVLTALNVLTIGTVIVSGLFFAKLSNWSIPKSDIPVGVDGGNGGFIPFGWSGIVSGAAKCFYAYIGFDSIATTGDETKNPKKTIPLAIVLSLSFITIAYCSVSSVLTLMWPYYDQRKPFLTSILKILYFALVSPETQSALMILNSVMIYNTVEYVIELKTVIYKRKNCIILCFVMIFIVKEVNGFDVNAPLPVIYENLGLPVIKYIVSCGAVFALLTTLLGCLFPIPRILYAMSSDGLLFEFLSRVNSNTKTPLIATLISGLGSGILSSIFNLQQLVDMTSIGTLMTYLIVCICVLVLRYKNNNSLDNQVLGISDVNLMYKCLNLSNIKITNSDTQYVSRVLLLIYTTTAFIFCICLVNVNCYDNAFQFPLTIAIWFSAGVLLVVMVMLNRLPQAIEKLSFRVPLVPFVPCLNIVLNLYLMMELNFKTWIRFCVGVLIGLLIYAFYGIRHSLEGAKEREMQANENKK